MDSLLERIGGSYESLSSGKRRIANYLYHNIKEAFLIDSVDLAHECSVSEATVSRFIKNLGYSGFKAFKKAIGEEVLKKDSLPSKVSDSAGRLETSGSVLHRILEADTENLRLAFNSIDIAAFDESIARICSARCIYILGLRTNFALSFYLNFHLRYFLNSVRLLSPGFQDIPDQIYGCRPEDLLIVISSRRHVSLAIEIAAELKEKGAFILAITDDPLCQLARMADILLIAGSEVPSYMASATAALSLMNALVTGVAMKKKEVAMEGLRLLEDELNRFKTFDTLFKHGLLSEKEISHSDR